MDEAIHESVEAWTQFKMMKSDSAQDISRHMIMVERELEFTCSHTVRKHFVMIKRKTTVPETLTKTSLSASRLHSTSTRAHLRCHIVKVEKTNVHRKEMKKIKEILFSNIPLSYGRKHETFFCFR